MAPKRAYVSLNLNTDASHAYQRVEDHGQAHPEGSPKLKVYETTGPTVENTHLDFITKPIEKLVNQTVDSVVDGTGKKVASVDGQVHYQTSRTEFGKGTGAGFAVIDGKESELGVKKHSVKTSSNNHPNSKPGNQNSSSIEDKFDTSDL